MWSSRLLLAAKVLMVLGLLPYLLVLCWVSVFFLQAVPGEPPPVPVLDPLAMTGLMITTYVLAAALAGPSILYSLWLTRRNAALRSRTTAALQIFTLLLLAAPLLWTAAASWL